MNCIAATLSATVFSFGLAHARADPACLETAAARSGELIDTPRAVMATSAMPLSLQRNFKNVW